LICQECQARPATLHFTKIINGEKTEVHICEQCSREKGYSSFFSSQDSNFSFHNLLAGLLNMEQPVVGKKVSAAAQQEQPQCPKCHMTYQQFTRTGRFGCVHCYEAFQDYLQPILRRLHSGNTSHHGKIPRHVGGNLYLRKELDELKHKMQHHIQQEEFEEAAKVRDRIRTIEQQLSEHRKEE
jgi:protein arginine kinase activator